MGTSGADYRSGVRRRQSPLWPMLKARAATCVAALQTLRVPLRHLSRAVQRVPPLRVGQLRTHLLVQPCFDPLGAALVGAGENGHELAVAVVAEDGLLPAKL